MRRLSTVMDAKQNVNLRIAICVLFTVDRFSHRDKGVTVSLHDIDSVSWEGKNAVTPALRKSICFLERPGAKKTRSEKREK